VADRGLLIAGNWKMNGSLSDARRWAVAAVEAARGAAAEVAVFPPYPWLGEVGRVLAGSPVALGAQACHPEPLGAFTGGVSAAMLMDAGCRYVLCGHSERRLLAGETDVVVAETLRRALEAGLEPVLCVGETLAQRKALETKAVLSRQLEAGLAALPRPDAPLTIAYEPVWAIGTGVVATPAEAREAHGWIRLEVGRLAPPRAPTIRILYGGSVKPDNMDGLLAVPDVDGALVGGASLDPVAFARLVKARRPG
jgi:triosephosphate isomerase (TIM)